MSCAPVHSGRKYLSVRCNTIRCDNMLVYAELPDKADADTQDRLEQQYLGKTITCPLCREHTRIYEGLVLLVR